jgi:hypothetical protein
VRRTIALGLLAVLYATPAWGDTLTANPGRYAAVRAVPQLAYTLPPIATQWDASTVCINLGDECVTPDGVMHLQPGIHDSSLVAHERGHVLDFRTAALDPSAANRFRTKWEALNKRAGVPWTTGINPPMEQFAESFGACSRGFSARFASHAAFRYGWHPSSGSYDATCHLLRREVRRLSRLAQ